jgi:hypothetical protein
VIGGRTVRFATSEPGKLLIQFDDQSIMKVKTAGSADVFAGAKLRSIQEDGAAFILQFEDGSTVTLQLADPGSSVAVRDKNNQVEYLGWAREPKFNSCI